MKFYLLKNEKVQFDIEGCDLLPKLSALVPTCLSHKDKSNQSACENIKRYLNAALREMNMMQSGLDEGPPPTKKPKSDDYIQAK